ncbi:xylulokinase [Streptomyces sp. NPDC059104]|uniref:xylulokinase n=1 Tax=Streptomyces sp. NPDC059104 TaxID=3346729 RepID=UPI003680E647
MTHHHPLVLGIDSSTQSTKAVLVEADTGRVRATGRAPHEVTGTGGARESDPATWVRALCAAVGSALADLTADGTDPAAVTAVAVAGQQHGLVTLDDAGRPLRPALLWNDTRSAPQAASLLADLGGEDAWTARTGSAPVAAFTATKWRWLRENEPDAAAACTAVRLPHDFLTERLCGHAATDPGEASGTGWYSTALGAYDDELLRLIGLDRGRIPPLAATGAARAGLLTTAAARALGGLTPGIPVAVGTGDNMAAALGLGLGRTGLLHHPVLSLGTSGTVFAATTTRPAARGVSGFASADGAYLPLACTLNCTLATDRIATLLGLHRDDVLPGGETVLLPYLDGERTPDVPGASGILSGLRHGTTPQQILGAAYEGASVSLLRALDSVLAAAGADPAAPDVARLPIRLIGGGARGRAWVETVRRLSGRPVIVPASGEVVARGAAALAVAAATGADPVTVALGWQDTGTTELPALDRDTEAWERVSGFLDRATPLL